MANSGHKDLFRAAIEARRKAAAEANSQVRVQQRREAEKTAAEKTIAKPKHRSTAPKSKPASKPAVKAVKAVPVEIPEDLPPAKPAMKGDMSRTEIRKTEAAWNDKESLRVEFSKHFSVVRCNEDVIVIEKPFQDYDQLKREDLIVEIRRVLEDNQIVGAFIRPAGSLDRKKFRITLV